MKFHEHVSLIEKELNSVIYSRSSEIRGLFITMLCRMNMLLTGAPGGAKTFLVDQWAECFKGIRYFSIQNNPFTKNDDVEGPVDGKEYRDNGRLIRKRDNYMTKANIVCLDELPRTEAVLPCYLKFTNEKKYTEDGNWFDCELEQVVGTGNHMLRPEFEALLDRFIMLFWPEYMTLEEKRIFWDNNRKTSVNLKEDEKLTLQLFQNERQKLNKVTISEDMLKIVDNMMLDLEYSNIIISDRAYGWMTKITAANALCEGRMEIMEDDLWILRNVFARNKKEFPKVCEVLRKHVNKELDNILASFDSFSAIYKEWTSAGKINSRLFEGQAREISDSFKKISPRSINKVEYDRCLKSMKSLHQELNIAALNEMRHGTGR